MKNLKKVLCLALAFAMVLGLCVSGLAAVDVTTLSDWDEVANKDAVKLLNAFDIMQGDERGVRPDDTLTRAEAAKMLSVALWGGRDDNQLYAAGNVGGFTDVDTSLWYIGYINFMAVNGIINGDAEGTFRPTATVSGYELLKMCLTALGYDAEKAGLVGAGWDLRAMSLATKRTANQDLTEKTDVAVWKDPITRSNAAQVIANMINRNLVSYTEKGVLVEDDLTNGGNTFGTAILGMETSTGVLVANQYGSLIDIDEKNALDAKDDKNAYVLVEGEEDPTAVTINSTFADLGKTVTVYTAKRANSDDDALLVSASLNDTAVAPTFDKKTFLINNLVEGYTLPEAADDGDEEEAEPTAEEVITGLISDPNYIVNTLSNDPDSKGKIDTVIAWPLTSAGVTEVATSAKNGTVINTTENPWNEKKMAEKIPEGVLVGANSDFEAAKGDVIMYVTSTNVYGDDFNNGCVLECVEGVVSKTVEGETSTAVTIDGTKYTVNKYTTDGNNTIKAKADGKFWLFPNSTVIHSCDCSGGVDAKVPGTYALVYNTGYVFATNASDINGTSSYEIRVSAVLPDGTNKTFVVGTLYKEGKVGATPTKFEVDATKETDEYAAMFNNDKTGWSDTDDNGKIMDAIKGGAPALIAYSLNEDGTIDLYLGTASDAKKVEKTDESKDITVTSGTSAIANTGKYLTSKSVTYVKSGKTWVVYTGLTVPTSIVTTASAVYGDVYGEGTSVTAMVITETGAAEAKGIYYITGARGTVVDSTAAAGVAYEIDAYSSETNSITTYRWTTAEAEGKEFKAGQLYNTFNAKTGFSGEVDGTFGFITTLQDSVMVISDQNESAIGDPITITASTVIVSIDGEDSTKIEAADLAVQDVTKNDTEGSENYQVIVVKTATGNNAATIIVFEDVQSRTTPAPAAGGEEAGE